MHEDAALARFAGALWSMVIADIDADPGRAPDFRAWAATPGTRQPEHRTGYPTGGAGGGVSS